MVVILLPRADQLLLRSESQVLQFGKSC